LTVAPLLKIENLKTYFFSRGRQAFIRSVDGVSFEIQKGETLGVVGESGSGKSVMALSVMGLVAAAPGVIAGRIGLKTDGVQKNLLQDLDDYVELACADGRVVEVRKDVVGWNKNVERLMGKVRGKAVAMIFQSPKSSLNPFLSVGRQIAEAIRLHTPCKGEAESRERALYWLERVRMDSPGLRFDNYPRALSGGMCQRAMVAMALSCEPSFLIADEPTTGLDATIQSKIADLLAELKADLGITTMLISHDIGVIRRLSDSVAVMYGGMVVEYGPAREVLAAGPESGHPYTAALLASVPGERNIRGKEPLQAISGDVPDTIHIPNGCRFYGRCGRVTAAVERECAERVPPLLEIAPGHSVRCWLYGGD
jgi:oligopeptide/dipeptide ABC transporter ATP-binding protein